MTQGMAPILKPAFVGTTADKFAKALLGQLLGRGIPLNPSKGRTAGGPFDLDRSESSFTRY